MRRSLYAMVFLLLAFPLIAELDLGSQFAVAIEKGDAAKVKELLDGGAAADTWIEYGQHKITPLMKAAWEGEPDIVQMLLDAGAKVDAQASDTKETALHSAIGRGQTEVVKILLAAKADVKLKNAYDFNPLTSAAAAGQQEIVAMLLDAGAKIDDGAHTLTPLMFAVSAGNADMVKYLASRGADVNAGVKSGGQTALRLAITMGNAEMVKTLIALKANVTAKNSDGVTPLMQAQKGDQDDIIALLKAAGAKS